MKAWALSVRRGLPALLVGWLIVGCAGTTEQNAGPPVAQGPSFSAAERARIDAFYSEARRRPAPAPRPVYKPGDTLDSGMRPQPLPTALRVLLPDPPKPFTRLVVGGDVILVDRDSHVIADVIPAVAY